MTSIPNILSIAGSDPSGAAGIQADLKTISANGGYGMAALTCLTAQNSRSITGLHMVPPGFVAAQIASVLSDIRVDAIKIGMLGETPIIETVIAALADVECPIVLDPVMVSTVGNPLLARNAVSTLREQLIPLVTILTPNLPEAAALLGCEEAMNRAEMETQAQTLLDLGAQAILLKGGHLCGAESPDLLMTTKGAVWFESIRLETKNSRGTGCTLSSALATQLALTNDMEKAVTKAKEYVFQCLSADSRLLVGEGLGPLDHLKRF